MARDATFRLGTSGWQYEHWKERFYPVGLSKREWLEHYARHFDAVEVNNTFYNLPGEETFDAWRETAPRGFRFALKFSRFGTHMKKLKDPEQSIGLFLERAERLGAWLGPILVQLPPHWHRDPERLDAFLRAAPRRHRWAIEFRDADWLVEEVFDVLREHGAALCLHDMLDNHPRLATSSWVYLRFHGPGPGGPYSHQALSGAARRVAHHLDEGRDVHAYFNNDAKGYALEGASRLARYVERARA